MHGPQNIVGFTQEVGRSDTGEPQDGVWHPRHVTFIAHHTCRELEVPASEALLAHVGHPVPIPPICLQHRHRTLCATALV